jgi:molecular chaperone Hsp33
VLPGALPEDIEKLEANVQKLEPVTTMLAKGMTVEQMCEKALEGFTVEKLDEMPVHYACTCSRKSITRRVGA